MFNIRFAFAVETVPDVCRGIRSSNSGQWRGRRDGGSNGDANAAAATPAEWEIRNHRSGL